MKYYIVVSFYAFLLSTNYNIFYLIFKFLEFFTNIFYYMKMTMYKYIKTTHNFYQVYNYLIKIRLFK